MGEDPWCIIARGVTLGKCGGIGIDLQPGFLAFRIRDPQLVIFLQAACEMPFSHFDRLPNAFVDVPTVNQNVRAGVWQRLKLQDHFLGQVYFAPEGRPFSLTDRFLPVHLR